LVSGMCALSLAGPLESASIFHRTFPIASGPANNWSIVLWQTNFSGWTFQRHFQHNEPKLI